MMITLRPLTAQDAPAYVQLRRQVAEDSPLGLGLTLEEERARSTEEFAAQLGVSDPNLLLGAFDGEALVATAGVTRPTTRPSGAHKGVLWGVLTAPEYRRRGLARALSLKVVEHARETGVERLYLYVYLPNAPAVRLYESLGFVTTGVEPEVLKLEGEYHDLQQMSRRCVPRVS